jgi:hypothetical protein
MFEQQAVERAARDVALSHGDADLRLRTHGSTDCRGDEVRSARGVAVTPLAGARDGPTARGAADGLPQHDRDVGVGREAGDPVSLTVPWRVRSKRSWPLGREGAVRLRSRHDRVNFACGHPT